jgi:hypothetical protein
MDITDETGINPQIEEICKLLKERSLGFGKTALLESLAAWEGEYWFGGQLAKMLEERKSPEEILTAFKFAMSDLIRSIGIAMNLNYERAQTCSRRVKRELNDKFWETDGEGERAKRIVQNAMKEDPYVSAKELARILTKERVLTFAGKMKLPANRQDKHYKWSDMQVYKMLTIIGLSITKRPKPPPVVRRKYTRRKERINF